MDFLYLYLNENRVLPNLNLVNIKGQVLLPIETHESDCFKSASIQVKHQGECSLVFVPQHIFMTHMSLCCSGCVDAAFLLKYILQTHSPNQGLTTTQVQICNMCVMLN